MHPATLALGPTLSFTGPRALRCNRVALRLVPCDAPQRTLASLSRRSRQRDRTPAGRGRGLEANGRAHNPQSRRSGASLTFP